MNWGRTTDILATYARYGETQGPVSPAYESSETEYWFNVMPQAEMPIAGTMEHLADLEVLKKVLDKLAKVDEKDIAGELASELLKNPEMFHDLRKLLGISDKRAYLELSFLASRYKHPTEPSALCGCQPWTMARHPMQFFIQLLKNGKENLRQAAAKVMSKYLLGEGLEAAAKAFSAMSADDRRDDRRVRRGPPARAAQSDRLNFAAVRAKTWSAWSSPAVRKTPG